ncbi:Alkaline phosphatase synthesis sensor protein PhoR [compost metagenome]
MPRPFFGKSWHDGGMRNEQGLGESRSDAPNETIVNLERANREVERLKALLEKVQQRLNDREQDEYTITEQNTVYKAIFDAQSDLGEGFFIVDGRKIVKVNEAFTRISGYSFEELSAFDGFFDLVHEDERAKLQEMMAQRLQGSVVNDHYETMITHKLGHPVNLEVAVKVIHLGSQPRILAIARDITGRKRMEAALHAQNLRLQELDALKSSFISTVSHELRTPLATIMGYTEFLEEQVGGPLSPEQQTFVSQIGLGAKRLEVLVDDLLDFARLESGSMRMNCQEGDLTRCVRDIATGFHPLAQGKGISLKLDVPDGPLNLRMDGLRIAQVIANLMSNALKFTPPGGRVRVGLEVREGEACVEVEDSGIGISQEHLPYLFERFYQVDPSTTRVHGGAGLGLPISKALIESHGGRIGVRSQVNEGSTFWFALPLESRANSDSLDEART